VLKVITIKLFFVLALSLVKSTNLKAAVDYPLGDWSMSPSVEGSINIVKHPSLNNLDDVVIAVIDTGIDYSHPALKNKIISYKNGEMVQASPVNYGRDFSPRSLTFSRPFDTNGHGTHIASIITKVAPNAKILPIKYYNQDATEKENLDATIEAIKFAINAGIKIINYSSGGSGKSVIEKEVINLARKNDVLLIAAAGNFGEDIDKKGNQYYPASYNNSNIISVINHGPNFKIHKTSNFGEHNADISAPGTLILGAFPDERYGNLTGTSQATAFVSAAAAIIKGISKNLNHEKIKHLILTGVTKVPHLAKKCKTSGALNIRKIINLITEKTKRNFASTRQKKSHP